MYSTEPTTVSPSHLHTATQQQLLLQQEEKHRFESARAGYAGDEGVVSSGNVRNMVINNKIVSSNACMMRLDLNGSSCQYSEADAEVEVLAIASLEQLQQLQQQYSPALVLLLSASIPQSLTSLSTSSSRVLRPRFANNTVDEDVEKESTMISNVINSLPDMMAALLEM